MLGKYHATPTNPPAVELSQKAYWQGVEMRLNVESHTPHYRARVSSKDFKILFLTNHPSPEAQKPLDDLHKAKNKHATKFAGISWTRNRERKQWILTVNASDAQKLNALDLLTFAPDKRFVKIPDPMTLKVG